MSHSTETVLGWLARKWRDWSRRRRTMMALDCGVDVRALQTEQSRVARVAQESPRRLSGAIALGVILLSSSEPVLAQSMPAARRGFLFVRMHCAQCHAIDKVSESPLSAAPPLRTLRLKYPVADLQRPLADGIHPAMPRFRLEAHQVEAIMAYLKTLEP